MAIDTKKVVPAETLELVKTLERRLRGFQRFLHDEDRRDDKTEQHKLLSFVRSSLESVLDARVAASRDPEQDHVARYLINELGRLSAEFGSIFDMKEVKDTITVKMKPLQSLQPTRRR